MKKKIYILSVIFLLFNQINCAQVQSFSDTLNSVDDVHITTYSGSLQGYKPILKFDISSIPAGSTITSVTLGMYIASVGAGWDGDVLFSNVNSQTWVEASTCADLWNIVRSDSISQLSSFGTAVGWTYSIDISQIFETDYNVSNTYCSIMVFDIDDSTATGTPGPATNTANLFTGRNIGGTLFANSSEHLNPDLVPVLIVNYDIITSTEQQDLSDLKIYPNPFTDHFFISSSTINTGGSYAIYNSNQQNISNGYFEKNSKIEIPGLDSGIYFLILNINNTVITRKILKP